ncbi:helix-turn-helix domain-containing protein [Microbacterium sp. NPDC090007]|uniref:helix-turn-helix domain-containing protein n=1 Tax=Microbacterium sp. NPDC090007 TaxID=3364204 RepID=UPI00380CA4C5
MPSNTAPVAATYVSIATAADILACSTKTIRRKIASGELPARCIGTRLIRIDATDLAGLGRPLTTARRA